MSNVIRVIALPASATALNGAPPSPPNLDSVSMHPDSESVLMASAYLIGSENIKKHISCIYDFKKILILETLC